MNDLEVKKYLVMVVSFSTAWLGKIVLFSGVFSEAQKIKSVFIIEHIGILFLTIFIITKYTKSGNIFITG